jgi:hypothetical protein
MSNKYLEYLEQVAQNDVTALRVAEKSYGDSWKKRGGIGAFMMLARKWDRLENFLKSFRFAYDIFEAIREDQRPEGIIDDIRDLRRYLMLVEAEILATEIKVAELAKYVVPPLPVASEDLSLRKPTSTDHPAPFGYTPE